MIKKYNFSSQEDRNLAIVQAKKRGQDIASLAYDFNLSTRHVYRIIQRYEKNGNLKGKAKSGRPSVLTRALKAKIIWLVRHHPNYTAVHIAKELNNVVSHDTITRYLKTLNFSWKKASKIPMLSEEDREARINFAKIKRSYDFSNTIFTDETTFFLDYSLNVWGKKGERIPLPTKSHPQKVQVWTVINELGPVVFHIYEGNMNQFKYREILEMHLIPQADELLGFEWELQQDGATSHTAISIRNFLEEFEIPTIDWPARSPDLNPIENIWGILKRRAYQRFPLTLENLINFIEEEWNNIPTYIFENVCLSMNDRLEMILENNGNAIEY